MSICRFKAAGEMAVSEQNDRDDRDNNTHSMGRYAYRSSDAAVRDAVEWRTRMRLMGGVREYPEIGARSDICPGAGNPRTTDAADQEMVRQLDLGHGAMDSLIRRGDSPAAPAPGAPPPAAKVIAVRPPPRPAAQAHDWRIITVICGYRDSGGAARVNPGQLALFARPRCTCAIAPTMA